jgi:hypothetical protein
MPSVVFSCLLLSQTNKNQTLVTFAAAFSVRKSTVASRLRQKNIKLTRIEQNSWRSANC